MMPIGRQADASDLPSLLALFEVSEVSAIAQPRERAESIWQETLAHPGVHVFVSDDSDRIPATCMLVIAPNLLRSRRHGFLENVVTHPELRGRGHGKAVVLAALKHAWAADCHHVLMQSGRADPRVHAFYEGLGFMPGLRVAYVARMAISCLRSSEVSTQASPSTVGPHFGTPICSRSHAIMVALAHIVVWRCRCPNGLSQGKET